MTAQPPTVATQPPAVSLRLRPLPPPPITSFSQSTPISIYHPINPFPGTKLLALQAFDGPNGAIGLHYGTAIVACGILAGNRWDGYLTETQTGRKVTVGWDEVLQKEKYYFHIPMEAGREEDVPPSPPNHYPIIPRFQDWTFPHHNLPPTWNLSPAAGVPTTSPSDIASAVLSRDPSCRLSSHRDCRSCAHLCPSDQAPWFTANGMQEYNLQTQSPFTYLIDDVRNGLALRVDLHADFDKKKFVFVPKMGMLVAHMLQPTYELGRLYHNSPLLGVPGISMEFVLVRFAWAIFPSVSGFLGAGVPRLLQRVHVQQDGSLGHIVAMADAQTCRGLSGANTPSPAGRKTPMGDGAAEVDDAEGARIHKRLRTSASPSGGSRDSSRSPQDHQEDGDELCGCSVISPLHFTYEHNATMEDRDARRVFDDSDCDILRPSIEDE